MNFNYAKIVVTGLFLSAVLAFICALLFSCMSSPKRGNYSCDECYMAADALYRLKSANDKATAIPLVEACRDAMKEVRRIQRLEYCKKSAPADMTERECRSWINEK